MLSVVSCMPIQALWTPSIFGRSKCIDVTLFLLVDGTLNAITSHLVLGLALPIAWAVRGDKLQNVAIALLLLIGAT